MIFGAALYPAVRDTWRSKTFVEDAPALSARTREKLFLGPGQTTIVLPVLQVFTRPYYRFFKGGSYRYVSSVILVSVA